MLYIASKVLPTLGKGSEATITALNSAINTVGDTVSKLGKRASEEKKEEIEDEAEKDAPLIDDKIRGQMKKRGWSEESVSDTIKNPRTTRKATNKENGNPAEVYYDEDGSYVSVDVVENKVIQISNKNNPNWIPDDTIIDPFKP